MSALAGLAVLAALLWLMNRSWGPPSKCTNRSCQRHFPNG